MFRPSLAPTLALLTMVGAACAPPEPSPPSSTKLVGVPWSPEELDAVPAPTSVRLSDDVVPLGYDLHLAIDPKKPRFSGEVHIRVDVRKSTRRIVLHGRDLVIEEAVVEVGGRRLLAKATSQAAFGAREAKGELVLTTDEPVAVGPASIRVRWSAAFTSLWGLYRTETGTEAYAFSQMEPIEARRAFPSFDEPRFKTPFAIQVTTPKGIAAFGNGAITRTEAKGDEVTHVFAPTPPIPVYLTAFAVGRLERKTWSSPDHGIVAVAGRAEDGKESAEASQKILAHQGEYFAIPYVYGKLDSVAVPDFGPGAMENPGLVTYRDELLLLGADPPAEVRRRMRGIVAHELAHQWFGNLVTMAWWDDLWLNEAFATWMGPKTVAELYPETRMIDDRVLYEARAIDGDILPSARAVRPTITTEDAIHEAGGWSAYLKGSTVLAMVERWIGPDRFREGLRRYMQAHGHGNATFADLVRHLEDAAPGRPVGPVLRSFIEQPGVPAVDLRIHCTDSRKPPMPHSVHAYVEPLRVDDAAFGAIAKPRWKVPVCLRVEGEPAPQCFVADGPPSVLQLRRCPAWVHPDADEVGYYRWSLDDAWWGKLLQHAGKLSPSERAGLVLNAWSLAQTGQGTLDRVIAALRALGLRKDEPRVVVEAVVIVLRDLERTLVDDRSREDFRALVRSLLEPVAIPEPKLPRTTAGDEQRLLRATLLGALTDLAPGPSAAAALAKAKRAPDPDLAALALRLDARAGDASTAAFATEAGFLQATSGVAPFRRTAILQAMGSFGDEARQRQAFEVVLSPSFRAGDWRHVRLAATRTPEGRRALLRFMTDRFEPLAKKLGGAGSLTASIGFVCDASELSRLETFFGPKMEGLEGAQRGFDEGRAEARRCIALRARLGSPLGASLGAALKKAP